jgi:hypothetical protein
MAEYEAMSERCRGHVRDANVDSRKEYTASFAQANCYICECSRSGIAIFVVGQFRRDKGKPINGALPEQSQSRAEVRHVQVLYSSRQGKWINGARRNTGKRIMQAGGGENQSNGMVYPLCFEVAQLG